MEFTAKIPIVYAYVLLVNDANTNRWGSKS